MSTAKNAVPNRAAAHAGLAQLLSKRPSRAPEVALAALVACTLHVAAAFAVPRATRSTPAKLAQTTQTFDLQPEPSVPEPEPPPPPPDKVEPPPQADSPPQAAAAQAPAPAEAAAVLAQAPDPSAPADMTDTVVMGNAETYAGGSSASNGTSKQPVAGAVVGGVGTASAPTSISAPALARGPDLSRRARLAEGASWACPFPPEADDAQLDQATVTLQISVSAAGVPLTVNVTADPGNGFGRAAKSCAQAKRYAPALDAAGTPVAGVSTVNVHFNR